MEIFVYLSAKLATVYCKYNLNSNGLRPSNIFVKLLKAIKLFVCNLLSFGHTQPKFNLIIVKIGI